MTAADVEGTPDRSQHEGLPGYVAHAVSRRDAAWVLRRCARRGHVLAYIGDDQMRSQTGPIAATGTGGALLRCLRCGTWLLATDEAVAEVVGSADEPAALGDVPLLARGPHGRRFGLLRLLALERGVRGLLMVVAGMAALHVADQRDSILSAIERLAVAARPLGEELGVHVTDSLVMQKLEDYLGGSGDPVYLAGFFLTAYGALQVVEGIGLWGGWRWAEYLAVIVTSAFIPLEVYELVEKPTVLKALALVLNVCVVVYLLYKGRLFGLRGGHRKFLAELRDATLPADLLVGLGRSPEELSSTRVV
jgi:uncharacterized membrane protein (DUF2068 family)